MKYTKELLESYVIECKSIADLLNKLGLKLSGGNYTHISKKLKYYNIDTSHFLGQKWGKNIESKRKYSKEIFIEKILICSSNTNSHALKLKLFEFGLKDRKCENCGQGEIWFNNKLSLHLEHINGIHNDNRLINLKILCPNCHSQTPTYAGKKNKGQTHGENAVINKCACGKPIKNNSTQCVECYHKTLKKVERPPYAQLVDEVNEWGYCKTGKKYGVSDNAIRKWIKKMAT